MLFFFFLFRRFTTFALLSRAQSGASTIMGAVRFSTRYNAGIGRLSLSAIDDAMYVNNYI